MSKGTQSVLIPFAVACVGIALFSVMDGVMKGLVLAIGAYNAMLWRQGAGFLIGGSAFLLTRSRWPSPAAMRLHVIRGIVGGALAFAFFWGIARVPLAEGIALSFIAPIITLFLASIILKERISRHSIIASLLGLAGVGVILSGRIGGQHDSEALMGVAAILLSAVLYAYNLILQRQQAQLAGLRVVNELSFGPDYAETLRRWRTSFLAREADVRRLHFDTRFMRIWEFYLAYCEAAFAERYVSLVQLVLERPGSVPTTLALRP